MPDYDSSDEPGIGSPALTCRGLRLVAATALALTLGLSGPVATSSGARAELALDAVVSWPTVCQTSVRSDFEQRDQRPSRLPKSQWYQPGKVNASGPRQALFPEAVAPPGCDPIKWKQARILAVVDRVISMELSYCHHRIPFWQTPVAFRESGEERCSEIGSGWRGLDCSSFSLWVYNYGLGQRFKWSARRQADGPRAPGERVPAIDGETITGNEHLLQPGDLIFVKNKGRKRIGHVAIWIGSRVGVDFPRSRLAPSWQKRARVGDYVIADSTGIGPRYRPFRGWYKKRFSHARRLIQ